MLLRPSVNYLFSLIRERKRDVVDFELARSGALWATGGDVIPFSLRGDQAVTERLIFAVAIVVIDALLFVIPVAGLFVAYVIVARPPWVREWLEALYAKP